MKRLVPRWRKMTWVLLIWTALIAAWMISAAGSAHGVSADCQHDTVLSAQACNNAEDAGTGIAIVLIGLLGFLGFVALSLVWFMSRPKPKD